MIVELFSVRFVNSSRFPLNKFWNFNCKTFNLNLIAIIIILGDFWGFTNIISNNEVLTKLKL